MAPATITRVLERQAKAVRPTRRTGGTTLVSTRFRQSSSSRSSQVAGARLPRVARHRPIVVVGVEEEEEEIKLSKKEASRVAKEGAREPTREAVRRVVAGTRATTTRRHLQRAVARILSQLLQVATCTRTPMVVEGRETSDRITVVLLMSLISGTTPSHKLLKIFKQSDKSRLKN